MKLSEVVPSEFLKVTDNNDFTLYKHQEEAIKKIRNNRNVIVSVPTASGKTLIAYISIYDAYLKGKKSMYIVPLRSLAMEKFAELLSLKDLGLKVTISIGDYDVPPSFVKNYDVIIATSERADSMLHRDPDILNYFGLVIIDEIHMIGDESRGPRLETVISSILYLNPEVLLLGLSATVSNIKELAEWMNSDTVISDFRAVPLETGIIFKNKLISKDDTKQLGRDDEVYLIKESVESGGQVLVFRNSRRNAEKYSESLTNFFNFKNDLETMEVFPDLFTDDQLNMILHGVMFHHAGLSNEQRTEIEKLYKNGYIKILAATPTLAAGVNLPARTVIIRDITRFSDGYSKPISAIEIQQMLGRAGRPKYDKKGYGYIYVSSPGMMHVAEGYLSGELEPVMSHMDSNSLIRFNILAIVSSGIAHNLKGIESFYAKTLLAIQNDIEDYGLSFESALYFLIDNDFIKEENGFYSATKFGTLTSELYIDPVTSLILKQCIGLEFSEELYLYYICKTPDMITFNYRTSDYEYLEEFLDKYSINDFSEESMKAAKTAIILNEWINEVPTGTISENFGIGPGDIQAKASSADWISYSLYRMAHMFDKEKESTLLHLNIRIKEGVKEEIVRIIEIPGIGRVRGRRLYSNGFASIEAIANAKIEDISRIFGFSVKLAKDTIENAGRLNNRYFRK
ncbi:ATP-dependent DNA helicase [Ferroplasma sp.]|uniref:ATP-dependent DNA helicase n=1 Tax=Ferroplasma sp. TaxID=2591003 RepID=UPI00307E0EB0